MTGQKILYIGGTGEISQACMEASVAAGDDVTVLNRGRANVQIPDGVRQLRGDVQAEDGYRQLGDEVFDVVCQFLLFSPEAVDRDIDYFSNRCGQYVFISSASAYQKPPQSHVIAEDTPLDNRYWAYSRAKAACENQLQIAQRESRLNVTIVRPSHTYRTRLPGTCISGDHLVWRMQRGKPVIVHGDGQSLWTLTHAADFADAFVGLFGQAAALGTSFHITDELPNTWDVIVKTVAQVAGCDVDLRHVASETLVKYPPGGEGPLLGDKANSVCFDNSKVRSVVGPWQPRLGLQAGFEMAWPFAKARLDEGYSPTAEEDALIDRIINDQEGLGH